MNIVVALTVFIALTNIRLEERRKKRMFMNHILTNKVPMVEKKINK